MPRDGNQTARLWAKANAARRLLANSKVERATAQAALEQLLAAEAALDFDDEAKLPAANISTEQRVGTLLPLRLETRFVARPDGSGKVLLRIFPESVAFDQRARPAPGESRGLEAEGRALDEFWDAAGPSLETDESQAAFLRLAETVGAARAAWLVSHLAPGAAVPPPGPPLAALPATLGVWLARAGGPLTRLATLAVAADKIAEQSTIDGVVQGAGFESFWWNSFEVAKSVGLACELELDDLGDIDLLLVAGIGDFPASELWRAHAESGRMGALAPGTATNSVDGSATAVAAPDAREWLQLLTRPGWAQAGTRALSLSLTGDATRLPALPGGEVDVRTTPQRAAMLLVPAVLGRALIDQWSLGLDGHAAARWATRWLLPAGPCPTLRLGDVPYGVLPAAPSPRQWVAASDDPPIEASLLDRALAAAGIATSVAEAAGTVQGAETDRVLTLLTLPPVTAQWSSRPALLLSVADLVNSTAGPSALPDVVKSFDDDASAAVTAGLAPQEALIALGDARPLPRARTDREKLKIRNVLELAHKAWSGDDERARDQQNYTGELLLGRERSPERHLVELLIDASVVLTHARLASLAEGGDGHIDLLPEARLEQLAIHNATAAERKALGQAAPLGAEILRAWDDVRDALEEFLRDPDRSAALVDAAYGLLDVSSHRADAWVTGAAERRLRRLARAGVPFVVGAYGWVDAPRPAALDPRRAPGPTDRGLIHAPGADHAAAAAILRDRACASPDPRWDIALDSASIRGALKLASYVRAGISHHEALGREVERIVGDVNGVRAVRDEFRGADGGGRQVCDGEAVIAALAPSHPDHAKVVALGLTAGQLEEIAALTSAVDAYADLLVTDATFALAAGKTSSAAPALDGAAGLGPPPPELRAVRTPRRGQSVGTRLWGLLPAAPPAARAGPSGLAAPELAAALVARFGAASAWTWQRATPLGPVAVSLASVGLDPVDVLALEEDTLRALLGEGFVLGSTGGAERVAAAKRFASALTGRAAVPATLPMLDDARADTLRARLIADLALLAQPVAGDPGSAPLVVAARWGISVPRDALAPGAEGSPLRRELVAAATAELAARLAEDTSALPLGVRVVKLAPASLPPPPSVVGGAAALGLGGAVRRADLDETWLSIIASVRSDAAALEAYQLAPGPGATPLHGFTASLSPWQLPAPGRDSMTVAYGPPGILSRPEIVGWSLGSWNEVVPAREHETHAAFGWNAPDSRAPQAVLVAVPPDLARPLSEEDVVATVAFTRQLARARAVVPAELRAPGVASHVTPLNLLHASGQVRVDASGEGLSRAAAGVMLYERIEPAPATDTLLGLQAKLADPLWLIGRQWQLGELQGEDASSPVELRCETSNVRLESADRQLGRPGAPLGAIDPALVPAEAVIEADPSSWWTLGRRARLGALAAARLQARGVPEPQQSSLRFAALPPPYRELTGQLDGRAVFQSGLLAGDALWAEVPATPPDHFRSDSLDHRAAFRAGSASVRVDEHDGGEVDWWSADATSVPTAERTKACVVPGRLRYPGAAQPRYWQLEDADNDPSAFPPDAARWATALWSDAVTSAGSDWFSAPVPAPATSIGSIVTLHGARVRDSFDEWWPLAFPRVAGEPGPDRVWSLHRTRGLPAGALVLWPSTLAPLSSAPLDEVIFGVDEDADLCWAVELRVDGASLDPGSSNAAPREEAERYLALPSWGLPLHGHPYRIEAGFGGDRVFVQGLVADLSGPVPRLREGPRTSLLGGGPRAGQGHTLQPNAVPSVGIRLVRKWCLARATDGSPVLWLQRERSPLLTGPVSHLRFDVAIPDRQASHG